VVDHFISDFNRVCGVVYLYTTRIHLIECFNESTASTSIIFYLFPEVFIIKKLLSLSILLTLSFLFLLPLSFSSNCSKLDISNEISNEISPCSSVYTFGLTNNAQYTINDTAYQNWNYQGWKSFNDKLSTTTFPNDATEEYVAGTSSTASFSDGYSNHHKVVYCNDASSSSTNGQWNVTFNPIQIGTIEFYLALTTYDGCFGFKIGDAEYSEARDNGRIDTYTWPTMKMYSTRDGFADVGLSYSFATWYHFRYDFNTVTDTFSVYRDGTLWDSGAMNGDSNGISRIIFGIGYGGYQSCAYVDAVDISSSEGYYPRRNQVINSSLSIMSLFYPVHQMASLGWTSWNLYVTPNAYNSITGIPDGTALIHLIQNLTTGTLLDVRFSSGSIASLIFNGPPNKVELYSESDQITKWVFDQPTIIYNENFSTWGTNKSAQFNYTSSTNYFYNIYEQYPTLHQVQSVGLLKSGPTTEIDTYFQFSLFSQTHFSGQTGKYSIGTFVPSPNYIDLSNC
jgi:hypothetical protein